MPEYPAVTHDLTPSFLRWAERRRRAFMQGLEGEEGSWIGVRRGSLGMPCGNPRLDRPEGSRISPCDRRSGAGLATLLHLSWSLLAYGLDWPPVPYVLVIVLVGYATYRLTGRGTMKLVDGEGVVGASTPRLPAGTRRLSRRSPAVPGPVPMASKRLLPRRSTSGGSPHSLGPSTEA